MLITNYMKSAWRVILRHRLYSLINIVGLAVGMAACLMIFLFVRYETSYDKWMEDAERVYRLNYTNFYKNGEHFISATVPGIAKAALEKNFPEIESATRFYQFDPVITVGGEESKELVWFADPNLFETLKFEFTTGNADEAFNELSNIVLSEKMAVKFFGDGSPIGEVITIPIIAGSAEGDLKTTVRDYVVTGVFRDIPKNSEFNFEIIFPLDTELFQYTPPIATRWFNTWGYLYFKLREGVAPEVISSRLEQMVIDEVPLRDDRPVNQVIELTIVNLLDAHLHSEGKGYTIKDLGSITQVYTFSVIAALILLIACINFMNLSTARSMQRAREVSMRKVLGANRGQLIRQFLGENIVVAAIGLVLAISMVEICVPIFNNISSMSLEFNILNDPMLIGVGFGLLIIIGVVAGVYPAFYLTAFRPSDILASGSPHSHKQGVNFRTSLTIFQFSISIALIISTAVVYGQNIYSVTRDLGFEQENKLIIRNMNADYSKHHKDTIANEIRNLSEVEDVSYSIAVPTDDFGWHNGFSLQGEAGAEEQAMTGLSIDEHFLDIYKVPVLFGRNFEEGRATDKIVRPVDGSEPQLAAAILNESAARQLGFSRAEDAIGRVITWQVPLEIIGIVPDTYFNSARNEAKSFVYYSFSENLWHLTVSYREGADEAKLQGDINKIWDRLIPSVDLTIEFMEDMVKNQYLAENIQAQMLLSFSGLAIIVACLGLYGLAAFTAEQRTKEIALRKVHGAGVVDILKMLLIQFSKPVLMANIFAWPVAWYFSTDYLSGFAYRIDLGISYFIVTGLLAILIAWITTTQHAIKAANASPSVVLRAE